MGLSHVLNTLKSLGFEPDRILDLGARTGDWTRECMKVYPHAHYNLIDAIHFDDLHWFDNHDNVDYSISLVSDVEKEVDWYELKNSGDSMFKEVTAHFKDVKPVKRMTTTLSSLFPDKRTRFDLIKIDCQGSEIPILEGGKDIMSKADIIVLEMPFMGKYNENVPSFIEHVTYMDHNGFIPFNIVENHQAHGILFQIDMAFVSKTHPINERAQLRINSLGA